MKTSREYPNRPIVGVGGVTIHEERVLLIKRAYPPLQGQWSIPGGGLDVGETIADGVRRELKEETGIDVRVLDHIETFERIQRDASGRVQFHYVILDYLCELIGGEAQAGGDATAVTWSTEGELARCALTETATRVIQRAFVMARERRNA